MNVYQEMVEEFHQEFGGTIGQHPELRDRELRAKLILEEAVETAAAMGFTAHGILETPEEDGKYQVLANYTKEYAKPDFVDTIDGLADTIYVVLGAAITFGIDLDPFFMEVHRSNMAKVAGGKRGDGKILKPEGWKPPDIERILIQQLNLAEAWKDLEAEFWAEGEVVNTTGPERHYHADTGDLPWDGPLDADCHAGTGLTEPAEDAAA